MRKTLYLLVGCSLANQEGTSLTLPMIHLKGPCLAKNGNLLIAREGTISRLTLAPTTLLAQCPLPVLIANNVGLLHWALCENILQELFVQY